MGQCVVVVEDEPDILAVLRDVLELEDYSVVGIPRPDLLGSALSTVEPDLFLIDIMLPGMSGVELAQSLHDCGYETIPMIAMSASRLMAGLAGDSGVFAAVLDKPFDLSVVLDWVQRCTDPLQAMQG